MGFTSNDALLMARKPAILNAMLGLINACYEEGEVTLELKKLVAVMTSSAAGCQYCATHTRYGALNEGVSPEKLSAIWDYENSESFNDAERAALDVARTSAFSPNETTDAGFARLKQHYTDSQIVELVAVISLFGFLNRWNSSFQTDIEAVPAAALQAHDLKIERS